MQYTTTMLLSALAATAIARPATGNCRPGRDVNVILSNSATELGSTTTFCELPVIHSPKTKDPVGSSGPFATVELSLGDAVGRQNLRCQILGTDGEPIVVFREENVDVTFADGGNGPWTFRDGEQEVDKIVCSGNFVKGEAPPADVPAPPAYPGAPPAGPVESPVSSDICDETGIFCVELANSTTTIRTHFVEQGAFREVRQPFGGIEGRGPFTNVTLLLGGQIRNTGLRCQLIDQQSKPIVLRRGQNTVTKFGDGGNGAWTFFEPQLALVQDIICDPEFVADPQTV